MVDILGANVVRNALSHVDVLHVAAAACDGRAILSGYDATTTKWGLSKIVERADGERNTFEVATAALDDIVDERRIDHVDVLKMDIEGAEDYAVAGMADGLKRQRYRRILLELHPGILAERGRSAWDVLRRFSDAGYRGWWIDYSAHATRHAAYTRRPYVGRYLRPLVVGDTPSAWQGDAWPHVLWLASGIPCPA
jgi:FkbM family methyltransferase